MKEIDEIVEKCAYYEKSEVYHKKGLEDAEKRQDLISMELNQSALDRINSCIRILNWVLDCEEQEDQEEEEDLMPPDLSDQGNSFGTFMGMKWD